MSLVYANAVCTISATASATPSGGCFRSKQPFQNSCLLRSKGEFSLVVRSPKQDTEILEDLFEDKVESAPLTKRGWTFQERYLSKRVLHFCDGDVFFECNEMQASEYHVQGVPYSKRTNIRADGTLHSSALLQRLNMADEHFTRESQQERYQGFSTRPVSRPGRWRTKTITRVNPNRDYKTQPQKEAELASLSALFGLRGAFQLVLRSSGKQPAENMEFHQCWYDMIEQYSTRGLSWHTDKLMAVAGVAYFIQEYAGRIFLAGLWMSTLPFNLLWTREDPASVGPRPIRNLPTWSWASVDGVISHRLKVPLPRDGKGQKSAKSPVERYRTTWQDIRYYIDKIDSNSVEPLLSHNSLIHNTALRLSCALIPFDPDLKDCSLNFIPDIALDDFATVESRDETGKVDIEEPNSKENNECLVGESSNVKTTAEAHSQKFWWMPVLSFKNDKLGTPGKVQWHGLVLRQRIVPSKTAAYERVGYYWMALSDSAFKSLLRGDKELVKCGIRLY